MLSFLDPTGHSVEASFRGTVENNGVDTKATQNALAGKTGTEVIMARFYPVTLLLI